MTMVEAAIARGGLGGKAGGQAEPALVHSAPANSYSLPLEVPSGRLDVLTMGPRWMSISVELPPDQRPRSSWWP